MNAGDAGVEPGSLRLRAAVAEHGVPACGGRGLRRHQGTRGPPRPAYAAGGPGEALSTTRDGLTPFHQYLHGILLSPDSLHNQTTHREIWLT